MRAIFCGAFIASIFVIALAHGSPPVSEVTSLIRETVGCDRKKVERLLRAGIDVNAADGYGNTALMYALGVDVIESLRHAKKKHVCQIDERSEIVELLLQNGADVSVENVNGGTPLILAIYHGNKSAVELLIKFGANVNRLNLQGKTPLMYSAMHCDRELAEILISAGADIEERSEYGNKTASEMARAYSCTSWR